MSHRLVSHVPNQFRLWLDGEPDYVQALPMAPAKLEPELTRGDWLVLVFAVWSMKDIKAIQTAIEFAKKRNGEFKLGIRPFDRHEELKSWAPMSHLPHHESTTLAERGPATSPELFISSDRSRSPLWLFLKDGVLIGEAAGPLSQDALAASIRSFFGKNQVIDENDNI